MPVEKQRKLVQEHVKFCLDKGIKDMAPSQNITSPSKVLERDFVLKNIEGQVGESCKKKLSLFPLSWSRGRWRFVRWNDLILGRGKPQSLCPERVGRGEGVNASISGDGEEGVDASIMGDGTGAKGTKALM